MNKINYRKAFVISASITFICGIGIYSKSYLVPSWKTKMKQISPEFNEKLDSRYDSNQIKIRKMLLVDLPYKEKWTTEDADILIDLMNTKYNERIIKNKMLNDSSTESMQDTIQIQNVQASMACVSLRLSVNAPVEKEALKKLVDALIGKLSSPFYLDRMVAIAAINESGCIYLDKCYKAVYELQQDPVPQVSTIAKNSIKAVNERKK